MKSLETKKTGWLGITPILVGCACIVTLTIIMAFNLPPKFATGLPSGGVSLLRDDFELSVYHERVSFVYRHVAPYAESRIEYPLLGSLYLAIPALFATSQSGYSLGLMILNGVAVMLLIFITYRLLVWLGRSPSILWLFLLPGVVYFTLNRFDVLPALLVQSALLALFMKKWNWSFLLIGLSVLAKGYAILLFPIFFSYWLIQNDKQRESLWNNRALWTTVGTVAIGLIVSIAMAGLQEGLFPYYFQSTRNFAFGTMFTIFIVGIWNLAGVKFITVLMQIATKILIIIQFIVPALIYGGHTFFKRYLKAPENVINWSIVVILIYVLFSPYYSPQWLLWLVPLLVLWQPKKLAELFVVAYGLIGYLEYPAAINIFGFYSTHFNMLVLLRTVLLIGILVVVCQQIKHYIDRREKVTDALIK